MGGMWPEGPHLRSDVDKARSGRSGGHGDSAGGRNWVVVLCGWRIMATKVQRAAAMAVSPFGLRKERKSAKENGRVGEREQASTDWLPSTSRMSLERGECHAAAKLRWATHA